MRKRAALVLLALALVGVAVLLWVRFAPRDVPPGQPAFAELSDLEGFHQRFNARTDVERWLVMLSPT